MFISKKLFLIIALTLGLNRQINASQNYNKEQEQNYIQFTGQLSKINNAEAKEAAKWMNEKYHKSESITNQLMDIVNTDEPVKDRVTSILKLKRNDENHNEGYFANISTFAKAAAAVMITAGIVSYLYFMRPWGTSTTQ